MGFFTRIFLVALVVAVVAAGPESDPQLDGFLKSVQPEIEEEGLQKDVAAKEMEVQDARLLNIFSDLGAKKDEWVDKIKDYWSDAHSNVKLSLSFMLVAVAGGAMLL